MSSYRRFQTRKMVCKKSTHNKAIEKQCMRDLNCDYLFVKHRRERITSRNMFTTICAMSRLSAVHLVLKMLTTQYLPSLWRERTKRGRSNQPPLNVLELIPTDCGAPKVTLDCGPNNVHRLQVRVKLEIRVTSRLFANSCVTFGESITTWNLQTNNFDADTRITYNISRALVWCLSITPVSYHRY